MTRQDSILEHCHARGREVGPPSESPQACTRRPQDWTRVQSGKLLGPFSRAETRISVFRPTPTGSIVSDNRREISSGNEGPIFRAKSESASV